MERQCYPCPPLKASRCALGSTLLMATYTLSGYRLGKQVKAEAIPLAVVKD